MPTSLLDADLKFANIGKKKELPQRVEDMESYLYQLLEQLRYSFGNLDRSNFNDAGFDEISGIISQPIIAEIKGIDGQLTQITATSAALTTRVEDAEGNITALYQFADEITQKVEDAEGNITALYQFADEITQKVEDAEGNITTLTATAQGLNTRVENAEGSISTLTQTANSLSSKVTSVEGSVSTLTQTVNSISLGVSNESESSTISLYRNGVQVSSQSIRFSGMVTFTDLNNQGFVTNNDLYYAGNTTINGGNITTGTIRAVNYVAVGRPIDDDYCVFSVENSWGNTVGYIGYDHTGGEEYLWIRTNSYSVSDYPSLKLETAGRMSIEAPDGAHGFIYIACGANITIAPGSYLTIFQGGVEWTFNNGNLYKGGTKVL